MLVLVPMLYVACTVELTCSFGSISPSIINGLSILSPKEGIELVSEEAPSWVFGFHAHSQLCLFAMGKPCCPHPPIPWEGLGSWFYLLPAMSHVNEAWLFAICHGQSPQISTES